MTRIWILIGLVAVGLAAWLMTTDGGPSVTSNADRTVTGETGTLYDGTVTTWTRIDADGTVTAVGATVPLETIRNAPTHDASGANESEHAHAESQTIRLGFPDVARAATYFDHLRMDYNPAGHPPAPYEVPHFDLHFYGISEADELAIECPDMRMPSDELVPSDYQVLPPQPEPEGGCVPQMGNHAVATDAPELRQENPAPFTETMILGYYGGDLIFLEPMITKAFLLEREGFATSVPVPERVGRSTRYPTSFKAIYDEDQGVYRFIWSDFVAKR